MQDDKVYLVLVCMALHSMAALPPKIPVDNF